MYLQHNLPDGEKRVTLSKKKKNKILVSLIFKKFFDLKYKHITADTTEKVSPCTLPTFCFGGVKET